jgi:type II secretion system protein I
MWRRVTSTSARPAESARRPHGDRSPRARRGESPQDGFTLIEVMVALTVVAFAFVGLLGLHNRNIALIARDQDLTRATLLARQFITEMELIEQFPDVGASRGEFASAPGFYWEREVEETTLPTVRRVHMKVVWDERYPNACEIVYYIRDRREPDQYP